MFMAHGLHGVHVHKLVEEQPEQEQENVCLEAAQNPSLTQEPVPVL